MNNKPTSRMNDKHRIIADAVSAQANLQEAVLTLSQIDSEEGIDKAGTMLQDAAKKSIGVSGVDRIETTMLSMNMHADFAEVLKAWAENGAVPISDAELHHLVSICSQRGKLMGTSLAVSALIKRHVVSIEQIRKWMEPVAQDKGLTFLLAKAAIDAKVAGITEQDVNTWLDTFVPNLEAGKKGRWDLYQQLALAVVRSRELDKQRQVTRKAIPGISETQAAQRVNEWMANLSAADEPVLVLELVIAAYEKGLIGFDIDSVKTAVDECLGPSDGMFVKTHYGQAQTTAESNKGIALAAYVIEKHGELLDVEDVVRWIEMSSSGRAYTNSSAIAVAITRHKTLRDRVTAKELIKWVNGSIGLAEQKNMPFYYLSAAEKAAALIDEGTEDITNSMAGTWIVSIWDQGGYIRMASPLMCAMIRNKVSMQVTADLVRKWMAGLFEYKDKSARETADVGIAAIQNDIDITADDIRSWVAQFLKGGSAQKNEGVRFIAAALQSGRFAFTDQDIEGWAALLHDQPVSAVEIVLAAQDAGIDVPEETILQWQAACFDGKTPAEAGDNAIALIVMYRNRPLYKAEQGIVEEISLAFEKIMQQRDSMGLTATTPYKDAIVKINALLSR